MAIGVLDIPAPLLSWLDAAAEDALPPIARVALWACLGASLSMALYRTLSPQDRIARLRAEAARARVELLHHDTDLSGLWPLVARSLNLSAKQLGLTAGPAAIASLPVLFLLVWADDTYGLRPPEPGSFVEVRTRPSDAEVRWSPEANAATAAAGTWQIRWPAPGTSIRLLDPANGLILSLPGTAPVTPVIHKRRWWNALVGNPSGYLPGRAAVEEIAFDLPKPTYVAFGPAWMRSWEAVFFGTLAVSSLAIKFACRIQ